MGFRDHHYPGLLQTFGLREQTRTHLFAHVPPVPASPLLRQTLEVNRPLAAAVDTELARAGWLIAPVLADLWNRYGGAVGVYSGTQFDADPDSGLIGYSDFLIGRGPQRREVSAPVVVVGESKTHTPHDGLGQCVAGMVGAQRFNLRNHSDIDVVYGCATTGTSWKFLRLEGRDLLVDLDEYLILEIDQILGILTHMIGPVPQPAAA